MKDSKKLSGEQLSGGNFPRENCLGGNCPVPLPHC